MSQPSLSQRLALLDAAADDPRIAGDVAEIRRQLDRIDYMRHVCPTSIAGVAYEHRRRERAALRVIEQRLARALRKLERPEGIAA